jgi:predicted ATPase
MKPGQTDVGRELYRRTLAERGYEADPAQLRAIDFARALRTRMGRLQGASRNPLAKLIARPSIPRGVYMHGGVGRGKSFLMDCFFNAVPLQRKTRLHFHEFMREVHRELADLQGVVDPLQALGKQMSRRYRLICFDEFHVADITDAMILHRLLEALFENRVSLVTTSNFAPDALYPNGLHRDRMLPAIELLKDRLEVVSVDNGVDYRQNTLQELEIYHTPLGARRDEAMTRAFEQLAEAREESPILKIEHREIRARRRGRRRRMVRLQAALRRPALAERLPRAEHPVSIRAALGRAADVAAPARRRALHLACRRALRPPCQADSLGARWSRGPSTPTDRSRTSSRAQRLASARDAMPEFLASDPSRGRYVAHMKRDHEARKAHLGICRHRRGLRRPSARRAPTSAAARGQRIADERARAEALYSAREQRVPAAFCRHVDASTTPSSSAADAGAPAAGRETTYEDSVRRARAARRGRDRGPRPPLPSNAPASAAARAPREQGRRAENPSGSAEQHASSRKARAGPCQRRARFARAALAARGFDRRERRRSSARGKQRSRDAFQTRQRRRGARAVQVEERNARRAGDAQAGRAAPVPIEADEARHCSSR